MTSHDVRRWRSMMRPATHCWVRWGVVCQITPAPSPLPLCVCAVRKWKVRTKLGGDRDWEYEVGEPPVRVPPAPFPRATLSLQLLPLSCRCAGCGQGSGRRRRTARRKWRHGQPLPLLPSPSCRLALVCLLHACVRSPPPQPTLSVRDAGRCWEWRIRNLPYPKVCPPALIAPTVCVCARCHACVSRLSICAGDVPALD